MAFSRFRGQKNSLTLYYLSDTLIRMTTLERALLTLKTEEEAAAFLRDLCTPGEIKDLNERWAIAQELYAGKSSYREIAETVKASITTVTRVARFLKDEPYKGYQTILARLNKSRHRSAA